MDIKKLMIGDWAYNKHHQKKIRLTAYDFVTHSHDERGYQHISPSVKPVLGLDIEPIPLTEEFFENNGIKKVDYDYLKPNVLFESKDKRIRITDLTNSGDGYWYVHVDNEDFDSIGAAMSSMGEDEKIELKEYLGAEEVGCDGFGYIEGGTLEDYISRTPYSLCNYVIDWLNAHHFDYRGLIEKGLALEAPEGMYNTKTE